LLGFPPYRSGGAWPFCWFFCIKWYGEPSI
jgi:hypothetical protein